ncbi:MAG: redoxin domain-containing protein [Verrucomicrobiales bacterium]|nr:redoxin domain-containing protein [Verrucomicrobiales bacterium]
MNSLILRISFLTFSLVGISAAEDKETAPAISLSGIDGKPVAPLDAEGKMAVVLFFVSPYCPTSNNFGPEMNAIVNDFKESFAFRFIHSDSSVKEPDMVQHASMMGFEAPVLNDTAQQLARHLGAKITPEAIVIDAKGGVLYHGRINDLYLGPTKRQREIKTHDLRDALTAIKKETPVTTPNAVAVGCKISGIE